MASDVKVKESEADAGTDEDGFPVSNAGSPASTPAVDAEAKPNARPRPTYGAEKVTELPAELKIVRQGRTGSRTDPQFVEALQVAQADAGEWYCVATFQSANGAKSLLKRIQKGMGPNATDDEKKSAPTVPAGDWDFEARRIEAPDSTAETPVRWSKLYAKSLG